MQQNPDNPTPQDIARGYELFEFRLRWLAWSVGGIILAAIIWHIAVWFVMKSFAKPLRDADVPRSVVEVPTRPNFAPSLEPTPQHDTLASEDLASLRAQENGVFERLGWKRDAQTGVFHPPQSLIQAVASREATDATTQPSGGPK
jgi:hypothetical protein